MPPGSLPPKRRSPSCRVGLRRAARSRAPPACPAPPRPAPRAKFNPTAATPGLRAGLRGRGSRAPGARLCPRPPTAKAPAQPPRRHLLNRWIKSRRTWQRVSGAQGSGRVYACAVPFDRCLEEAMERSGSPGSFSLWCTLDIPECNRVLVLPATQTPQPLCGFSSRRR